MIHTTPPYHLMGYVPDPQGRDRILAELEATGVKSRLSEAAPHLDGYYQGEDIGLFVAAKKCNNDQHLPADKQTIGDCVSHGHARGIDYLYCTKQVSGLASSTGPYKEGITSCTSEIVYGECREEGNGLGNQDGASGSWAVKALHKYGYIPRNGKTYDGSLAKKYGKSGVPDNFKTEGQVHILEQYALVTTPDDCANVLKAGSPVTVCSNQGFSMTRNADGICQASGHWSHCMVIIGVFTINGKKYFIILQSWGQNTPSGPSPMGGQGPDNSFGAEWDVVGRMLASENDSFALAGLKGFEPMKPENWVM